MLTLLSALRPNRGRSMRNSWNMHSGHHAKARALALLRGQHRGQEPPELLDSHPRADGDKLRTCLAGIYPIYYFCSSK